jgi:hypothetical protein
MKRESLEKDSAVGEELMWRKIGTAGASGPKIPRDQEGTALGEETSSVLGRTRKQLEEIQGVIR